MYTLVGQRILWVDIEEKQFEIRASTVSDALREALLQSLEREKVGELVEGGKASYRFALNADTAKGSKLILTVCGEGKKWSEAIEEAYIRVCGWQGKAPELPVKA